jgi:hypothetical protein
MHNKLSTAAVKLLFEFLFSVPLYQISVNFHTVILGLYTTAVDNLLWMIFWGTQWTMVSYFKE